MSDKNDALDEYMDLVLQLRQDFKKKLTGPVEYTLEEEEWLAERASERRTSQKRHARANEERKGETRTRATPEEVRKTFERYRKAHPDKPITWCKDRTAQRCGISLGTVTNYLNKTSSS